MRPVIGIPVGNVIGPRGKLYHRVYAQNARAIRDNGGVPVYIPNGLTDEELRVLYARLDGVLLGGGGDIDPSEYGEAPHPLTTEIDRDRDATELRLTRWAYADDLPVFGICRGHQVVNVALGGTLVQDIPSAVESSYAHTITDDEARSAIKHPVLIAPGTRLGQIIGTLRADVNSIHHQAVEAPAPGIVVSATAPDGVPEALEAPDRAFFLSVQWHPEDLYETDESMRQLFASFIAAASDRAARR